MLSACQRFASPPRTCEEINEGTLLILARLASECCNDPAAPLHELLDIGHEKTAQIFSELTSVYVREKFKEQARLQPLEFESKLYLLANTFDNPRNCRLIPMLGSRTAR